eukprot:7767146-Pyramimonas_sp.AAC.1
MSLMALAIASLKTRYPHMAGACISPADVGAFSDGLSLHSDVFVGHRTSTPFLSFNPQEIVSSRKEWQSTDPGTFALTQSLLIKVLLSVDSQHWEQLWMASLYRQHALISDSDGTFFYVLLVAPKALVLLEMGGECEIDLEFVCSADSITVTAPTSLDNPRRLTPT